MLIKRKTLFYQKFPSSFFINSHLNLTQTLSKLYPIPNFILNLILILKPAQNLTGSQTQTLALKKKMKIARINIFRSRFPLLKSYSKIITTAIKM